MANPKKTNAIGLEIHGGSGYTSLFGSTNLLLKSDLQSKYLDLFIKSKPITPEIQHKTNWDISLRSYPKTEYVANGDFEFSWNDFSSHVNDTFFKSANGKIPVNYTVSANWNVSEIDALDDIVAVAVDNWTSTEKIVLNTPLTDIFNLYSIYTEKITQQDVTYYPVSFTSYSNTVRDYTGFVFGDVSIPSACQTETAGSAVVQYTAADGSTETVTVSLSITTPPDYTSSSFVVTSQDLPVVISYSGTGNPCYVELFTDNERVETGYVQDAIPEGAVQSGNAYYFPVTPTVSNEKKSRIMIMFADAAITGEDPLLNEYLDYSDIFFEIKYSTSSTNANKLLTDVTTDTQVKTYTFDGYVTEDEFLNNEDIFNSSAYVKDDNECKWKILLNNLGGVTAVILSSYLDWNESETISYTVPQYFNPIVGDMTSENYYVKDSIQIAFDDIKIYKIVNFPNCGKVDLYTKITGKLNSTSDNITFYSTGHNLENNDQVKFTSALSDDNNRCDLNGVFYVLNKTENSFQLSYTKNGAAVEFSNLRSTDGIIWTKLSGNSGNLKYLFSLYSPCGKNGYSTTSKKLLKYTESSINAGDNVLDRGVEYTVYVDEFTDPYRLNYSRPEVRYPQGYFTGERSWNNFYPFQRFNNEDPTIYGIINGNKFGSSVKIKKYSDTEYIMIVAEEGATESFSMIDFFDTATINQKVIPSYLPYGRIHFYKLTKSPLLQNIEIEYLSSISAADHPWLPYENSNFNYKSVTYKNFKNYELSKQYLTSVLNVPTNGYWNGAKFISWSNEYIYDSTYNIELPDEVNYPYEFSFVDSFGKAIDFEIDGTTVYLAASSNVKNADFTQYGVFNQVNAAIYTLSYNISTDTFSSIVAYPVSTYYPQPDYIKNKEEFLNFANSVQLNNGRLLFGWPSEYKTSQNIYYYQRSGSTYSLIQNISVDGVGVFGEYLVSNDKFLLTHFLNNRDNSNSLTTNPLSYLRLYEYNNSKNLYSLVETISPTINLNDSKYSNLAVDQYEKTRNLSYDGTTTNSATYIMDLAGKYDLYNDTVVLKDLNEISIFQYDFSNQQLVNKYHDFFPYNDTDLSTSYSKIIITNSFSPATFDRGNDFDFGEFSQSLQIIDTSSIVATSEINYVFSSDIQLPNYLPLYLSVDPVFKNTVDLYLESAVSSSGDMEIYLSNLPPSSGSLDIYLDQKTITNNLNIYLDSMSGTLGYFNLTLGINPPSEYTYSPPIDNWILPSSGSLGLNILNTHTGVPNGSGFISLNLATDLYMDHASEFPLTLGLDIAAGPSSPGNIISQSVSAIGLYTNTYPVHPTSDSYTEGSGFVSLNLCNSPNAGFIDMIVYNIMSTGYLDMYTHGAISQTGNIEFYTYGLDAPQTKDINLRIKGSKLR
jgi:hypothetical protein